MHPLQEFGISPYVQVRFGGTAPFESSRPMLRLSKSKSRLSKQSMLLVKPIVLMRFVQILKAILPLFLFQSQIGQ